ncbi:MAG: glycosyltransferase N-terminal domain-containing protein [Verrucomicrobiota bacterium]
MRAAFALTLYRLLLPLLFLAAFPGWIVKMLRRGGFGSGLGERVALYRNELEYEPCGAIHLHAVSVGETMLALKLIREWRQREPQRQFVIATGTSTGHDVATSSGLNGVRVTYSPLDFPSMVRRYLDRFEPAHIVLVEGEVWPHLLRECKRRGIPVALVNARMSPRSARRFRKFAPWLRPIYQLLDAVALQEPADAEIWQTLGVARENIHDTGSLKFDPGSGARPQRRAEFQELLKNFGSNRPAILAASTHPGEETFIANAIHAASAEFLPIIVPRHAERRAEVKAALEHAGFHVILRSGFSAPPAVSEKPQVLVIDSTGELRDWTAHADAVVIGKSFLSTGGQNPCEAILAEKPVIFGPHMENFQPLSRSLVAASACLEVDDSTTLSAAIASALHPSKAAAMTTAGTAILSRHTGATRRIVDLLIG